MALGEIFPSTIKLYPLSSDEFSLSNHIELNLKSQDNADIRFIFYPGLQDEWLWKNNFPESLRSRSLSLICEYVSWGYETGKRELP